MVLLSGALLGPRLGMLSQLTYLLIGFIGLPVFAGGKSTLLTLFGPTGGYLIGFPMAAWTAGWLAQRSRSFPGLLLSLLLASGVSLLTGALVLGIGAAFFHWPGVPAQSGLVAGLGYGLGHGLLPFLPVDAVKAVAASVVAWPLLRKAR